MSLKNKAKILLWCIKNQNEVRSILHKRYDEQNAVHREEDEAQTYEDIIRNSEFFDEKWYMRNNFPLQGQNIDPAEHYLRHGVPSNLDPSAEFCTEEYLDLHSDVAKADMNPLLHYELFGRKENREIYTTELKEITFPVGAVSVSREYGVNRAEHKRVAILSCFTGNGCLPDTLIYLIKGLREAADNIILIGDCLIFPEELDKLDGLVAYASFERHEQYDFGSYQRGLIYAREKGLLDSGLADELVLMNDSCYGPVFPFSETFDKMEDSPCDFWGYTCYKNSYYAEHIQSNFMVFRRSIIDNYLVDQFLKRVNGIYDRGRAIATMETELTPFLCDNGMCYEILARENTNTLFNVPVTFLRKYRMPLVKKKAFQRQSKEDIDEAFRIIEENAPELARMIKYEPFKERKHVIVSIPELYKSYDEKCRVIAEKAKNGEKIRVIFMVPTASMFPSKPLFMLMMKDELFDPYIAVIPDNRWGNDQAKDILKNELALKKEGIAGERLIHIRHDELGRWPDICKGADIVCYNTPYHMSSFYYEPKYAMRRPFLPIMVNYGFYRSHYDDKVLALDSYTYLWKAFFECSYTLNQYKENSPYGGGNGEIAGYIKMDPLADYKAEKHDKKRILLALHHSVEGGTNRFLELGNITRYKDYFLELPDRYPEIDFIFRPHPFLYRILCRNDLWGEEKTEEFFSAMRSKANIIWSDGDDYFKEFAESDGCIQDCGSYLVEYMYTGKPCCYLLKDPSDIDSKFAELGKKCLEQCYVSYDTKSIDRFIQDVIMNGKDEKSESRAKLAEEIMVNFPHAAESALESIKKGIFGDNETAAV